MPPPISNPIPTIPPRLLRNPIPPNRIRPLKDISIQPARQVPRDMAVERPDARVIGCPLQDSVAVCGEDVDVSALGVGGVGDCAGPGSGTGGEDGPGGLVGCAGVGDVIRDLHFVAVDVPGVAGWGVVCENDSYGGVGADVVDVPLWIVGVGVVACVCEEEEGVVEVGSEGGVVDCPDEVAGGIDFEVDGHVDCCGGVLGCDGVRWYGFG